MHDMLRISQKTGMIGRLFGAGLLGIGAWFGYHFIMAMIEYARFGTAADFLSAIPGLLIVLFMMSVFGVPGLLLSLSRYYWQIDPSRQIVESVKDFFFYRKTESWPWGDFYEIRTGIHISRPKRPSERSMMLYALKLVRRAGNPLEILLDTDSEAHDYGMRISGLLGVPFRDETEGPEEKADPQRNTDENG